jgi:hypothetical protein
MGRGDSFLISKRVSNGSEDAVDAIGEIEIYG